MVMKFSAKLNIIIYKFYTLLKFASSENKTKEKDDG